MTTKIVIDKEERYRLAMSALFRIARYRADPWDDDYDKYQWVKDIATNTLESFGKKP